MESCFVLVVLFIALIIVVKILKWLFGPSVPPIDANKRTNQVDMLMQKAGYSEGKYIASTEICATLGVVPGKEEFLKLCKRYSKNGKEAFFLLGSSYFDDPAEVVRSVTNPNTWMNRQPWHAEVSRNRDVLAYRGQRPEGWDRIMAICNGPLNNYRA